MDAPSFLPEWIRTERRWSEQANREIDHFICDDEASLLYLINLGTIPLHVWSSRASDIEHPDWCVLDLDPKGAPFSDVVKVAQAANSVCEDIGLPCMVKTSGSSGLHLMIPLGGQCKHEPAEWSRAAHRGAVQRSAAARCTRFDATPVERGDAGAGYPDPYHRQCPGPNGQAQARPAARCPGSQAGHHRRPGATQGQVE
jgi:DNA primase